MKYSILKTLTILLAAVLASVEAGRNIVNITGGEIRIGVLLYTEDRWGGTTYKDEYDMAANFAIDDLNAATTLTNHTFVLAVAEEGNDFKTMQSTLDVVRPWDGTEAVPIIVGPIANRHALIVAGLSNEHQVNSIVPTSTDDALTDGTISSWTSLGVAAGHSELHQMLVFFNIAGWKKFGIIQDSDAQAVSQGSRLVDMATDAGSEIIISLQYPQQQQDISMYLRSLKASGTRIIVALTRNARTLLKDAYHEGLLEQQFVWVLPSYSYMSETELAQIDPTIRPHLPNIVMFVSYVIESGVVSPFLARAFGVAPNQTVAAEWISAVVYYDAVRVAGQAVDNLVRLKIECDGYTLGAGNSSCDALINDDDDGITLRRILRSNTWTAVNHLRFDSNGNRVVNSLVLQLSYNETTKKVSMSGSRMIIVPITDAVIATNPFEFAGYGSSFPADWPATRYEYMRPGKAIFGFMSFLAAATILLCCVCFLLNFRWRNTPIIRMSSPRVNSITAVGGALFVSYIFAGRSEGNDHLCRARIWLPAVSFTLLFGSMFAKTWRVQRIFRMRALQSVVIKDSQLLAVIGFLLCIDAAILIPWEAVSANILKVYSSDPVPDSDPRYEVVTNREACVSEHGDIFLGILLAYKGAMLAYGSYLAYQVRDVAIAALNDSKFIGLSIYSTTLIALITTPVAFLLSGDQVDGRYLLLSGSAVLMVNVAIALIFLPKLFALATGNADTWTENNIVIQKTVAEGAKRSGNQKPASGSGPGGASSSSRKEFSGTEESGSGEAGKESTSRPTSPLAIELSSIRIAAGKTDEPGSPASPASPPSNSALRRPLVPSSTPSSPRLGSVDESAMLI